MYNDHNGRYLQPNLKLVMEVYLSSISMHENSARKIVFYLCNNYEDNEPLIYKRTYLKFFGAYISYDQQKINKANFFLTEFKR